MDSKNPTSPWTGSGVNCERRQQVTLDFHNMILGKRLGGGLSREVFVFAFNPRYVVKIEAQSNFQNVTEYMIWEAVMNTEWARWFAPVKRISPLGTALIMRRATPVNDVPARAKDSFPKLLPDFLADTRDVNWGWLNGCWVMVDYGMTRLITNGLKRVRMVHGDKVASAFTKARALLAVGRDVAQPSYRKAASRR